MPEALKRLGFLRARINGGRHATAQIDTQVRARALALALPIGIGMSRHATARADTAPARASSTQSMVRWVFQRDRLFITCQVHGTSRGTFAVTVVPHWEARPAMIETNRSASDALRRHAEIAMTLREAGWQVARHTA